MASRPTGLDREIENRRRVQLRKRVEAARAQVLAREAQRAAEVADAERRRQLAKEYRDAFASDSGCGFEPWKPTENGDAA